MSLQETIDVIQQSRLSDEDKGTLSRLIRLISKSSAEMDGFELRLAREAAGLTVHQAAKLLQLKPQELVDLEDDGWEGSDAEDPLVKEFDRIYGLAREPKGGAA